jgi:glycosyltransferase involved in cell wall biosynthesis
VAVFVATTPHNSPQIGPRGARAGFPVAEVGKAASWALAAGYANAASIMAAKALVVRPDNTGLRATFDDARDQLTIARKGWTFPAAAEATPYEPAQRAVLAVLSQSPPICSDGYDTRAHGVLTALAEQGWSLRAVTRRGFPYDGWKASDTTTVPDVDHVDGIPYHRLLDDGVRQYPRYPLAPYLERFEDGVRDLAVQHRASLIQASSSYVAGMAGLAAARRLGLPFVYELRGLEELTEVSRDPAFEGSDRHRFLGRLETEVARKADRCFVTSEALGREMVRRGVSEDRIVVVPNGVDVDRFRPAERDRALEADMGLAGKTVIGYIGGLVDHAGLDVLLDAVASLKETRDDVRVIVVGDGPSERAVHAQAERLRLGDIVRFTGRVPQDQVPRYLSLIDIAPFPRLPLPAGELIAPIEPIESMAMGKAIIVSDVAALTEFVQDGVAGRVARKGDADDLRDVLEQLLDDPEQRRRLGNAAREWVVRERDGVSIAASVEAAYTEILAGATTPVH